MIRVHLFSILHIYTANSYVDLTPKWNECPCQLVGLSQVWIIYISHLHETITWTLNFIWPFFNTLYELFKKHLKFFSIFLLIIND